MDAWYVYAIKSEVDHRIYVGMALNPVRRLHEHNSGKTRSTKPFRPWKLIFFEIQQSRMAARSREKYFKSGVGKEYLRSLMT